MFSDGDCRLNKEINKQTNTLKYKPRLDHLFKHLFVLSVGQTDCPSVRLSVCPSALPSTTPTSPRARAPPRTGARTSHYFTTSRLGQSGSSSSHLQQQQQQQHAAQVSRRYCLHAC